MKALNLKPGFNVRVYGILLNTSALDRWPSDCQVLLIHERIKGKDLTKFPGGGVETGEAPEDALVRELVEEASLDVELGPFIYTSKKFHRSYFRPQQLISLYWRILPKNPKLDLLNIELKPSKSLQDGSRIRFQWHVLKDLNAGDLSHPLDREVLEELKARL